MPRRPKLIMLGLAGGAALVAGGVYLGRYLVRRARERAWQRKPGCSPDNPIRVSDLDEIEAQVERIRCRCGGSLHVVAQAGSHSGLGAMRVTRVECRLCDAVYYLYFDLTELRH